MSNYTAEEIDKATKMSKKNGKTVMENLMELTGRGMSPSSFGMSSKDLEGLNSMQKELLAMENGGQSLGSDAFGSVSGGGSSSTFSMDAADSIRETLLNNFKTLSETIEQQTRMLHPEKAGKADKGAFDKKDSASGKTSNNGQSFDINKHAEDLNAETAKLTSELERMKKEIEATNTPAEPEIKITLESFEGVDDEVKKKVFGQDKMVKKLGVAFKRPYVMPPEKGFPRNSIFLTAPKDTGKHTALVAFAAELAKRSILGSAEIKVMDLSLYPNAGNEKVFLQDLYETLSAPAEVILFENYAECHTSYLTYISSLVMEGKATLSGRYVMQKGQLISVNDSFTTNAVGSFTAQNKYLVVLSEKPLSKLADVFGAPFINALGDVCEGAGLEDEAIKKISDKELDKLISKAADKLKFRLEAEDKEGWLEGSLAATKRGAGVTGLLDFYENIYKALAGLRLEGDYANDTAFALRNKDGAVQAVLKKVKDDSNAEVNSNNEKAEDKNKDTDAAEECIDLLSTLPKGYSGEIEAVKAEMDNIVGLTEIKKYVLGLEEYYAVMKRRQEEGLKASEVNKHMIFTGNPGTGKTTIARIISRYLKAMGVLSGGQLVEVTRADLVGRYVGHTAPLTTKVIESALGGVLFIDEAYSLYRGKDDTFGLEAIDTLVKGIEDHRDDLIVILAGYSIEMAEFLTANSGLKSRFPNIINFPDYTGEELFGISKIIAKSKGYVIDEGVELALKTYYNTIQATRAKDAGNGRLVRNKIEEAIINQSKRLVVEKDADMSLLTSADFDLSDVSGEKKGI
ncbi:MAG: AAA family ATPase [Lachnospiraceae bacterium]|nr:AAA family ATPase [Lachnospiraceae bacterium]